MPLRVNQRLAIPEAELVFEFGPSQGPGGQNVNKVATRAVLSFDVLHSPSLTEADRARLLERLGPRLTKSGMLKVTAQEHRSQGRNRQAALERLAALLGAALRPPSVRRSTRVPSAERRRRLEAKKRRADVKAGRGRVAAGD